MWWLYVWIVWVVFNTLVLALYPTFIAPLFNKFSPMQDGELKQRIENLLSALRLHFQGPVRDGRLASAAATATPTSPASASPSASCSSTRSSRGWKSAEIEAVLAHELGHFKLPTRDQAHGVDFRREPRLPWLLGTLKDQAWFYEGLNVAYPATDAMALMLFFMVVPVFTFLLQPLLAMYSRKHEFEADATRRSSRPRAT